MSQVRVSGNASGTGILTVTSPNTNSNYTLTLPANTGTLLSTASGVAVNGPAFAAKGSATQTFGSGTWTKLAFQTEQFDTNSNYDNSTYRFTPTTAGYYQINFASSANESGAGGVTLYASVYKNGVEYSIAAARDPVGQPQNLSQSCVVSLNGSTDYVEIYGYISGGTFAIAASRMFSAALVRAA